MSLSDEILDKKLLHSSIIIEGKHTLVCENFWVEHHTKSTILDITHLAGSEVYDKLKLINARVMYRAKKVDVIKCDPIRTIDKYLLYVFTLRNYSTTNIYYEINKNQVSLSVLDGAFTDLEKLDNNDNKHKTIYKFLI